MARGWTAEVNRRPQRKTSICYRPRHGATYGDLYGLSTIKDGEVRFGQRCIDRVDSLSRGALKMYRQRARLSSEQKALPRGGLEMLDRGGQAS